MRFLSAALLVSCLPLAAQANGVLTPEVPGVVARHGVAEAGLPSPDRVMRLVVALPLRDEPALDAFLRDIYNPASPNYRHYLSVAAFTDRFGPAADDYSKAMAFFAAQGLQVSGSAENRYLFDITGKVADIERVFHVTMRLYHHPQESRLFIAPDREPTLDLDVAIKHVTGLDDLDLPHARLLHNLAAPARTTGSGPGGQFIGSDVRAAYYGASALTGAGQTLGLMELDGYNLASVQTYFAKVGQPLNVPVVGVKTDGQGLSCTGKCDDTEQALDIEYAISMAPGLAELLVYVGSSPEDVMNRMVSDNTAKQLSTSWGWGLNFATDDAIFKEMAAQGQTFLTASGDNSSLKASGPWPEEDANLTAVGGTDLVTHGAGGTWASETGWADSAGGPSVDKSILIESYQLPYVTTANGGSKTLRNVPDIAGDADTDNYICSNAGCGGGWGGTSFASPIWAGFIALANQQAAAEGKPSVGFINPTLYQLGTSAKADFHDEVSGKSGKFSCTPSFDLVTGLGSPAGLALITGLIGK